MEFIAHLISNILSFRFWVFVIYLLWIFVRYIYIESCLCGRHGVFLKIPISAISKRKKLIK